MELNKTREFIRVFKVLKFNSFEVQIGLCAIDELKKQGRTGKGVSRQK